MSRSSLRRSTARWRSSANRTKPFRFGRDQELAELMEQVDGLLPADALRQRDAPEQSGMTMK